jgi:hypothetical protein
VYPPFSFVQFPRMQGFDSHGNISSKANDRPKKNNLHKPLGKHLYIKQYLKDSVGFKQREQLDH